jgi:hypothetical protein
MGKDLQDYSDPRLWRVLYLTRMWTSEARRPITKKRAREIEKAKSAFAWTIVAHDNPRHTNKHIY